MREKFQDEKSAKWASGCRNLCVVDGADRRRLLRQVCKPQNAQRKAAAAWVYRGTDTIHSFSQLRVASAFNGMAHLNKK